MAFTSQATTSNLDLATFLKIYQTNGVYNNLPTQSDLWKYFMKQRAGGAEGKKLTYSLRTGYGPAAVQNLPISEGDYPLAQRSNLTEAIAEYKDFASTVSVPRSLLNRTGSDLVQYADPLTEELDAKAIVSARIMSAQMVGDGSGVIGVIASASTTASTVTITLDATDAQAGRSHVGWFMEDDILKVYNLDASARQDVADTGSTTSGAAVSYYKVSSVDADTDQVTCTVWAGASFSTAVQITDVTGAGTFSAGDLIYRWGTTPNDYSGSVTDYGKASECMAGLSSLGADDGRVVNNLTMSGVLAGSWKDAGASAIDPSHFQSVLSKAKRRAGKGRYKYSQAFMFDTVLDALVESNETDRRFQVGDPGNRGFKTLGYQHEKDFVQFSSDEFIQKKRIWILPESKDVLQFYGKDFETVEANKGQKFHLATASSGAGHSRTVLTYMEGSAVVTCKHPAAIACISNFTA